MKDVSVFLRSGETIGNYDVDDGIAAELEQKFKNCLTLKHELFELTDKNGKALFRLGDVIAVCINKPEEQVTNKVGFGD